MATKYGSDAQITGSLEVDGDIILGSGDDDISLDSNTLSIDAVNDRVGIGTGSPGTTLDVSGLATLQTGLIHGTETLTYSNNGGNMTADLHISMVDSSGGDTSVTLGDATSAGVEKTILCTSHGGTGKDFTVTVTNASWMDVGEAGKHIVFSASSTYIKLIFVNSKWYPVGMSSAGVTLD